MTIVITGVGGFRNRGVEAFTIPTIEHLRQQFPGEDIVILTPTPDYDSQRVQDLNVSLVRNDFNLGGGTPQARRLRQAAARLIGKQPRSERNKANQLLKSARMVVALGGDTFSSDYGQLHHHLEPLSYAQQHGVPVVFLAHSIGPFRTATEADAWSQVANRSALITVRESLTYQYVTETLGILADRVKLTADPAFLLAPPSPPTLNKLLESYGIHNKTCVALSVSHNISGWKQLASNKHKDSWRRVIATLLNFPEVQILLVPHVQDIRTASDDRIIATHLLRDFNYDSRIRLIGGDHSAAELKGLIGSCELVIAERMHAAMAGLSSGVCTVAIGYSVKAEGIMHDLLGDEQLKTGILVPVEKFVQNDRPEQLVQSVWEARRSVSQQLALALPEIKMRALENYTLIKNL
jgi:colanic acid/amylovoran biosynthesis protein